MEIVNLWACVISVVKNALVPLDVKGLICVLHVLSRGVPAPKGQLDPTVGRASSAWQASTRV